MLRDQNGSCFRKEKVDFDFVVAQGRFAQAIHQKLFQRKRERVGFVRFIGGYDQPDDPRYLTYFAYETVRTERTLHHGVDLDLRAVLG